MAFKQINIGLVGNAPTADSLQAAFAKINNNFLDLDAVPAVSVDTLVGTGATGKGILKAANAAAAKATLDIRFSDVRDGGGTFNLDAALANKAQLINGLVSLDQLPLPTAIYRIGPGSPDVRSDLQSLVDAISAAGGGRVVISAGTGLIGAPGLFLKSNVELCGSGHGTTLRATGGWPVITILGDRNNGTPIGNAVVRDLIIRGGGKDIANAHGVYANVTNRCRLENIRFFSCSAAVKSANAWQFILNELMVDGGGTDQSKDGLYLFEDYRDFAPYDNNCHIAHNVIVQGIERYGMRAENFAGSKFSKCQFMDGTIGVYAGDMPARPDGTYSPLQFGSFIDCDSDTNANQGWVFKRGNSPSMSSIWMANTWCGLTGANGGDDRNTPSFFIVGATGSFIISGLRCANHTSSLYIQNSQKVSVTNICTTEFDHYGIGGAAVTLDNSSFCQITNIEASTTVANVNAKSVLEANGSNLNNIVSVVSDRGCTKSGSQTKMTMLIIAGSRVADL